MAEEQQTQEQNEETSQDMEREERKPTQATIPKHRFDEVSKRMKEAESELEKLQQAQSKREEETASKQGEWQKLAETRKQQNDKKDVRIKELETQIVTGERYRAFTRAAQGVVLPDAVDDAFAMLTEDEFKNADTEDTNTYRVLAEGLVDRKPYLADGLRGSGSGGSSRPVFGARASENGRTRKGSPFGKATEKPPYR